VSRRGPQVDHDIYVRPKPETVADVWDFSSPDAAMERWHWVQWHHLVKIACEGRRLRRVAVGAPARHSQARSTTPAEDASVVESFHRLGTVAAVVNGTGLKHGVVTRILREAGIEPPAVDRTAIARKAAETRRQRRAA